MKEYYKKIICDNWAHTFIQAYSYADLNPKIQVYTKIGIHLYAENFISGGMDLSDLPGEKIYPHGCISESALTEEAEKQDVKKIILLLETDGYCLEYARNTKGDIICAYDSEEELELAEKTLNRISHTHP